MCADIFAGTSQPAWLSNLTEQKPGMLGDVIGELVGGLADSTELAIKKANDINAKGGETDADGNKVKTNWIKQLPGSIKPGLAEARLNADNPLWRIQAQQAQLNIAQGKLSLDSQQMKLDQQKSSMAQWEHDAPVLSKWMGLPYNEMLSTPIEGLKSQQALQIAERMKAAAARTTVNSALNRVKADFSQALESAPGDLISQIQALKPNPDGTPSPQQTDLLNNWRESQGMPRLGIKPTSEPAAVKTINAIQKAEDELDVAQLSGDDDSARRAQERVDLLKSQLKDSSLYVQKPEVIEVEGKKFLKWGKQLRDLSGTSAKEKAELGIIVDRIKKLQDAVIKDPTDADLKSSLNAARTAFNKFFQPKGTATPPAAMATPTQMTTVTTQEQFDALPSGSTYIGQDGKKYRKP